MSRIPIDPQFGTHLKQICYPIPLLLVALKLIHEKNSRVHPFELEHFHLPHRASTPIAILAVHATSFLAFLGFFFRFLVHATGAPVHPHYTLTSCGCWMLRVCHGIMLKEKCVKMRLKTLCVDQGQRKVRSLLCC